MVNIISWASYAYALSIVLVFYYALIAVMFYRNDVLNLLRRPQPAPLPQKKPELVKETHSEKSLNKDLYKPQCYQISRIGVPIYVLYLPFNEHIALWL
ncbi:hypothetical protein BH11BAC5_BH11BAC5_44180 [soil metagenome]